MKATKWTQAGKTIREILGLNASPVAVFLLIQKSEPASCFDRWNRLKKHRFCQALMKARHGESAILEPEEISCPAAANAFGFRPLPVGLQSGDGLVGFGIVGKRQTGARMFQDMPTLEKNAIAQIALCPLEYAPAEPDVIIVEDMVEKLMWLLLADLRHCEGRRRLADTAILQATCVDCTVIPFTKKRLNFSYGCYGCRDATDIGAGEAVVGFPGSHLDGILQELTGLAAKAIPASRQKMALQRLIKGGDVSDNTAEC